MIRYKLKDQERQTYLEKIFPGFGEDLQATCEDEFDNGFNHVCVQLSAGSDVFYFGTVDIRKTAIRMEEVYDPKSWNKYPEVTPPEKVWMRVEMLSQDGGIKTRDVAFYKEGRWCKFPLDNGEVILGRLRFRPWDEEAAK